jgi:hypothetical protein
VALKSFSNTLRHTGRSNIDADNSEDGVGEVAVAVLVKARWLLIKFRLRTREKKEADEVDVVYMPKPSTVSCHSHIAGGGVLFFGVFRD